MTFDDYHKKVCMNGYKDLNILIDFMPYATKEEIDKAIIDFYINTEIKSTLLKELVIRVNQFKFELPIDTKEIVVYCASRYKTIRI